MSRNTADITCKIVDRRERSIVIEDGSEVPGPFGGKVARRVTIPLVFVYEETADGITIPEWVAIREGLV